MGKAGHYMVTDENQTFGGQRTVAYTAQIIMLYT